MNPGWQGTHKKNDKTKYQINLLNVKCPFGVEEFNKKLYLNIELKKDNFDHQTILKDIKLIETYLLRNSNKEIISNIKNDILFKVTIPQNNKKILCATFFEKKLCNVFDVKGKTCDILIELNTIWEYENKTGVQMTVKTINIIN